MASKTKRARVPLAGDLAAMYDAHRKRYDQGWGLAWCLASELCDRSHVSHGIAFETIMHDGLGCYGIGMRPLPCKARRYKDWPHLGRFTMAGNAENWTTGEPGDHGLPLEERVAVNRETTDSLVAAAIAHICVCACGISRRLDTLRLFYQTGRRCSQQQCLPPMRRLSQSFLAQRHKKTSLSLCSRRACVSNEGGLDSLEMPGVQAEFHGLSRIRNAPQAFQARGS